MITINLLPESYRKQKVSSIQQFHRSPLALLVGGVVVGLVLVLAVWWQLNQMQLSKLTSHLQHVGPQKQQLDALKASVQELRNQDVVFQRVSRERKRWAKILNILSDALPDNVWFTDLALDQQGLVVQGSAIAQGGEEMVRIWRFVQELKGSADFAVMIRDIQIESIKTLQDKDVEIVEFTLTCKLTVSPAPS